MKFYIYIIFITITSCGFNASFQGLYSYYNKTKEEIPELLIQQKNIDSICSKTSKKVKSIYIVNGNTLKRCLQREEKSIVYVWGPNCKSKICYPLELIQSFCEKEGYSLYILAEYYDVKQMKLNHELDRNILAVDTEFYRTNLTVKYLNRFFKDVDQNLNYDDTMNRYLLFERDVFKSDLNSVYDLEHKPSKL